jgi:hypothetical protein
MGKEKGFALSPIRARDMRRFLARNGYVIVAGQHKHLKLNTIATATSCCRCGQATTSAT